MFDSFDTDVFGFFAFGLEAAAAFERIVTQRICVLAHVAT